MAEVVVYHSYNSKVGNVKFGNKVAYNNMVMNIDFTRKLMYNNATKGELDIDGTGLIGKKINHDQYFTKSNTISQYITNHGVLDFGSIESKQFVKSFDEANQLGMTVVSFDKDTSLKIKLLKLSEMELYEKIKPHINHYFEMNNLIEDNILYNLSFHSDKEHFHFHLDFVECVDSRTNLSMSTKSFNYLKREMMNIVSPDYEIIRKEILEELSFYQTFNNAKLKDFELKFENDKELKKAFHLINKEHKIPRYYSDIQSTELKHIIKSKFDEGKLVAPEYKKLLQQYAKFSERIMGDTTSKYVDNKLKEFEKRACNEIYRQLKQMYLDQFNSHTKINNEIIGKQLGSQDLINSYELVTNIENNIHVNQNVSTDELAKFLNDFCFERDIELGALFDDVEELLKVKNVDLDISVLQPKEVKYKKASSSISRRQSQSKRELDRMEYLIYEGMEYI